jgi:hypothetical protein
MIMQEATPGRGGDFGPPRQVSPNRALADLDAKLEQFVMNAGGAPEGIGHIHASEKRFTRSLETSPLRNSEERIGLQLLPLCKSLASCSRAAFDFISSQTASEHACLFEANETARRGAHQVPIAFFDDALGVRRFDMRMSDNGAEFLTGIHNLRERIEHDLVLILPRIAQFLTEIAFANKHGADARYIF